MADKEIHGQGALEAWEGEDDGFDYRPEALAAEPSEGNSEESLAFAVGAESLGLRLDQFLAKAMPEQSRARIQKWIAEGAVAIDGNTSKLKPSTPLKAEGMVRVAVPAEVDAGEWVAEPVAFALVYEDEDLLVVNKPAGLVVHPAAGHARGTLLNGLLHRFPQLRSLPRAGIVHRLDRDTTGLMIVAKTPEAQTSLVRQLQARTVSRAYLSLLWSAKLAGSQKIDAPIGRDPKDRQRMAVVGQGRGAGQSLAHGKEAITHLEVLGHGELLGRPVSLVQCRLETGRTHQIRVHVQHVQAPMVGDPVYAKGSPAAAKDLDFRRQALHAASLALVHPRTQTPMQWSVDPPEDFQRLCAKARIAEDLWVRDSESIDPAFWPVGVEAALLPREHRPVPMPANARLHQVRQVHGIAVVEADEMGTRADRPNQSAAGEVSADAVCADALIARQPGQWLEIRTADCLPVLAAWSDPETQGVWAVGGAHAGWRGLAGGVIEAMLDRLVADTPGGQGRLHLWLGPCIGPEAFEVGPEVCDAFVDAAAVRGIREERIRACFGPPLPGREPRSRADLHQIALLWLEAWRQRQGRVGEVFLLLDPRCTVQNARGLLSYRRGDLTERMRSVIGLGFGFARPSGSP